MKKALVTGASRGIGYAIAKKLSQNGCAVVITGRNIKTLSCVAHELGENVFPIRDILCTMLCSCNNL